MSPPTGASDLTGRNSDVSDDDTDEQLELIPAPTRPRKKPAKPAPEVAAELPVARVAVDTGLAHLDRYFDYLVPVDLHEKAVIGCRVKVRFAGQLVDGFLVDRVAESEHGGRLAFLAKVVSPEPVLASEVLALARDVADRYAGALGDVLRLAIPPRHARAEKTRHDVVEISRIADPGVWADLPSGPENVSALAGGHSPRQWWNALPGTDPARMVAHAVLATVSSGRGAIVCVPDARDVQRWRTVFADVLGDDGFVVLTAGQEPAERWRAFLAASRGAVRVVLGTRAAAYAPVHDLGLLALWDDGDDLFAEPRAPYPHTREVMLLRATREGCGLLVGGFARTAEGQSLVESGWCGEIVADLATRRERWPQVTLTDGSVDGAAPVRLPREVFDRVRAADGPVLVQVPRRGYRTSLSCQRCRTPARCQTCEGALIQTAGGAAPVCRWCGTVADPWACRECRGTQLRAPTVGELRTAEEFGRAFPEHTVVTSGGTHVLNEAPQGRTICLSTPGAEPPVEGGYRLVVLLDTWLMLARDDVRILEESHRRWFNALALAGPGAHAVVIGDPAMLQALVRADPVGLAARELADRTETHLPPAARLASIEADAEVLEALAQRSWPDPTEVLGPVSTDPRDPASPGRLILRTPRREGAALSEALRAVAAERSAAKQPGIRIQVDPTSL
jgi:primosomal protein N' (replication factor Y)